MSFNENKIFMKLLKMALDKILTKLSLSNWPLITLDLNTSLSMCAVSQWLEF
jgi:hypothetical protein